MNPWLILDIDQTDDKEIIRRAYMAKLAKHNPEDDPEGFQRVRSAYEEILASIDQADDDSPMGPLRKQLELLYEDFSQRVSVQRWRELLKEDVCVSLATEDVAERVILEFIMEHWYLPGAVLRVLNDRYGWLENKSELKTVPIGFVEYLDSQSKSDYPRYDLFDTSVNPDRFIFLFYEAEALVGRNETDGVDAIIAEMEETGIKHPCLLNLKTDLAIVRGEKENALIHATEAYSQHPDDINSRYTYARALHVTDNVQEALDVYQDLFDEIPEHFGAKRGVIECLISLEDYEQAREYLFQLRNEYPSNSFVLSAHQYVSEMLIEKFLKLHQEDPEDIEIAFNLAKHYLNRSRHDECYELLSRFKDATSHDRYYEFLGECMLHRGEFGRAVEYLAQDISIHKNYLSYVKLTYALVENGQFSEAIRYADEGLALSDIDSDTASKAGLHYEKGMALHRMDQHYEALAEFDAGIAINSHLTSLYNGKAYVYRALEMYAETIDCCRESIRIYPHSFEPYTIEIEIYLSTGHYQSILDIVEIADSYGLGEYPRMRYYKASALAALNRLEESMDILTALIMGEEEIEEAYVPRIYREIAYIYEMQEDFPQAIEYIDKAISLDNKEQWTNWQLHLGRLYKKQGTQGKALEIFDRMINEERFGSDPYIDRGESYLLLGDPELARESFETAINMDLNIESDYDWIFRIYADMRMYDEALIWVTRMVERFDSDENRNLRAWILDKLGMHSEEIEYLKEAIGMYPYSERLRQRLAFCFLDIFEDYQSALEQFMAILDINPDWRDINENIGNCLGKLGRYDEAIDLLSVAIDKSPDNVSLYARRGYLYKSMNRPHDAERDFLQALNDTEMLQDSWLVHGICDELGHTYRVYLNDAEAALKYFHLALEWDSEYYYSMISIGYIHYCNEEYEQAVDWFNKAIAIDGDEAMGILGRAEAYQKLGELFLAKADFERALNMYLQKPIDACIHAKIGSCYLGLGDHDEALAHFDSAIEAAPDCSNCPPRVCHEAYYELCLFHMENNQPDKAMECLERALQAANSVRYNQYKERFLK